MATAVSEAGRAQSASQADSPEIKPMSAQRDEPRVLFGSLGWPSGILEVASWVKHEKAGHPSVLLIKPPHFFDMGDAMKSSLDKPQADDDLVRAFIQGGVKFLRQGSPIRKEGEGRWSLFDEKTGCRYLVEAGKGGLEVYFGDAYDTKEIRASLERIASRTGRDPKAFFEGEGYSDAGKRIVATLGGDFVRKVADSNPNVVGFRMQQGDIGRIKEVVECVRQISDAYVVVGGPTVGFFPKESVEATGADFGVKGEGELPFVAFLSIVGGRSVKDGLSSDDKRHFAEIPGGIYRWGNRVYVNSLPEDGYGRTALDGMAFADRARRLALLDSNKPRTPLDAINDNALDWSLMENFDGMLLPYYPLSTGRGCPGLCVFCSHPQGRVNRAKSAAGIIDDIKRLDELISQGKISAGTGNIFLVDDDFFINRKRAKEFFALWGNVKDGEGNLLNNRYRLVMQTNPVSLMGAGGVDPDILESLDEFRVHLEVGGESFNEDLLKRWGKRHDIKQLKTVLDSLDRLDHGYEVFQIIADHRTTSEELVETLKALSLEGLKRTRMRLVMNPFMAPLIDSEYMRDLGAKRGFEGSFDHPEAAYYPREEYFEDRLVPPLTNIAVDVLKRANPQSQEPFVDVFDELDKKVLGWANAEGEGTARKGRLMELSAHIKRVKGQVYEEYLKLNPWERELQQ